MGTILAIIFGIYLGIGILLTVIYIAFQIMFWAEMDHDDIIKEALGLLFIWPWRFK